LNLLGFDYFEQIASFSNLYLKLLLKDIGRGKKIVALLVLCQTEQQQQ